jgi:AcrR family transcriptional regulator
MWTVSYIPLLPASRAAPLVGPVAERSDAARNRERLLGAARDLIAEGGVDALTMDRLAERARVGKGTVFRRFGSRTGLMMSLLSDSEAAFQARFMFGPPPLGPGAPGLERLVAFGSARVAYVLEHGDLVRAAESSAQGRYEVPAALLWQRHVEVLLREESMEADPVLMAMTLISTLDPERLLYAVRVQGVTPERLTSTWRELVTRVVSRR